MFKRDVVPDVESYRILMQGLCRKSQVNKAVDLLEDMLNKGEGRALDACKVLEDMPSNGCLPNLVSYRTLVAGLCSQGLYDGAKDYVEEMLSKGFSLHFSVFHTLIKGFCNVGKIEEACGLLGKMLNQGESPHVDTWMEIIPRICEMDGTDSRRSVLDEILKVEITPDTRIIEAGAGLEEYLIRRIRHGFQFAQGEEWSSLCDSLASRLMAVRNTLPATLCYIRAGYIDKTVEIWSRSLTSEYTERSDVDHLQDLMEKTIVLALATGQKQFSASLHKLVEKYAEILASQWILTTEKEVPKSRALENSHSQPGTTYGADQSSFGTETAPSQ
ncbi:hypothetical protein Vadar_009937 [Vaccinium darrowii]|uniref:Uncharacterized protein n=1 Tax=Vaccinium darrowii TaxID=229202 RepID=A0ACB7XGY1_9ERIC|nr:hypothetical protein Vadar_009937 [Vaccinium darrowii]